MINVTQIPIPLIHHTSSSIAMIRHMSTALITHERNIDNVHYL